MYDVTNASDEIVKSQYLGYFLKEINKVCQKTICFFSEGISSETEKLLSEITESIVVLPKSLHDEEIYREMLITVGWEELEKWDEVVLSNWSVMGPVFPLEEMFLKMKGRDADFWGPCARKQGVSAGSQDETEGEEYIPFRFAVFRNQMVKSPEFRHFWEQNSNTSMSDPDDELLTSEQKRERIAWCFAETMEMRGFKREVYAKTPEEGEYSDDYLLMDPVDAIRTQRCPLFLRESFTLPQMQYICESMGEQPWELFQYLKKETAYDTDLILDYLIKNCHQDDIARTLRLTYVLPSSFVKQDGVDSAKEKAGKTALVMHLYYMDLLEESLHYACSMPEDADVYLFVSDSDNEKQVREKFSHLKNRTEIRLAPNRGRDVSRLLVGARDLMERYELICFYHDKKTNHEKPLTVGHSFAYKLSECALCSPAYVENVLSLFAQEPRIGMLTGITPNHGAFMCQLGNEWGDNFSISKELADSLRIQVPLSEEHVPAIGLGNVFWFRTRALAPMFRKKWKYEDFPEEPVGVDGTILHAIERIYPFAVQEAGYLPGRIIPDHLASLEIDNLSFYVREYNKLSLKNNLYGSPRFVMEQAGERFNPAVYARAQTATLPAQVRLFLKRKLPARLYRGTIRVKRFLFGPKNVDNNAGEEMDSYSI